MGLEFAILALLPLGLLSYFDKSLRGYKGAVAGWIPLAIMAASAIAQGIQKHKQNKAAKKAAEQDNANVAAGDAAKQQLLASMRASGWDPTGVNTLKSGSTSSTQGRSSTKTYQRQRRVTEDAELPMEAKLRELVMGKLNAPEQITPAEKMAQVRAINQASAGAGRAIANFAGSQGLGAAQRGAVATPLAVGRTRQIADYLGSVPGQERDLAARARAEAGGFLDARAGSEGWGTSDTTSSSTTNQSGFGQQGPDIQGALALMTPGAKVSTDTGSSALLTGANSLLGGLSQYYGARAPGAAGGGANLSTLGNALARQNAKPIYPGLARF